MTELRISWLGAPQVLLDDEPLQVDTRKAFALLAYLTLNDGPQMRDALAALLWPELGQSRARAALRRTLSVLNKTLAPWLDSSRESVAFQAGETAWLDVDEFHAAIATCDHHAHSHEEVCPACLPVLERAVNLYRDDFMRGFSLRDSAAFDDWQFFTSEDLGRELAAALDRLTLGLARAGRAEEAIVSARRRLQLDPLHEPSHRQLMQLYAAADQRSAAIRQYRTLVRILDEELGVAPLDETTELYRTIQQERSPTAPELASAPAQHSPAELLSAAAERADLGALPLVGRDREWKTLLTAINEIDRDGRLILIEGEAGIGKTRLAHAVVEHARQRGVHILEGRCYEGESELAYSSFLSLLREAIASETTAHWFACAAPEHLQETARLLPDLVSVVPDLAQAAPAQDAAAQSRFFDGIYHTVTAALAAARPGILFLDDVHWADSASLNLLAYIARRLSGAPICILLTQRTEEASPQRLRQLVADAQRDDRFHRIELQRLDQQDVASLVTAAGLEKYGDVGRLTERLFHEAEGLPLFVVEYLDLISSGALDDSEQGWTLPATIGDLLRARLSNAGEVAQQILATAAVIGRSFDFDVLSAASGRSEEEGIAALDILIARGLICEADSTGSAIAYDFFHEQLRALVYNEMGAARRRLLHRRVAEAMQLLARRRGQESGILTGQLARHWELAGQPQKAANFYAQAGAEARQLHANQAARSHYEKALALGHEDRAAIHIAIGDLYTLSGEYGPARDAYETAAALCSAQALPTVEHKLGQLHHRLGQWELASSHFAAAADGLDSTGEAGLLARVLADWSLSCFQLGDSATAFDLADRALAQSQIAGDRLALAQSRNILSIWHRRAGRFDEAIRFGEESLQTADDLDDLAARIAAYNSLALTYSAAGRHAEALPPVKSALALCVRLGDRHREAALHNHLADLHHVLGNRTAAMEHLKEAVAIFAEVGEESEPLNPEIWKLTEW